MRTFELTMTLKYKIQTEDLEGDNAEKQVAEQMERMHQWQLVEVLARNNIPPSAVSLSEVAKEVTDG